MQIVEPVPGRKSVIGVLAGAGGGSSLMLNAHMDTVGAGGMADAFTPVVKEGRVYGRGAYDMKGSLAAIMIVGPRGAKAGAARRPDHRRGRGRGGRQPRHRLSVAAARGRCGHRDGADRASALSRAQGICVVGGRDTRRGGAWLAAGPRGRRGGADGPDPQRRRGAGPAAARRARASSAGDGVDPCLADRGRPGVEHLPGAMRGQAGAADHTGGGWS